MNILKTILTLIILQAVNIETNAQTVSPNFTTEVLIGPDDVDLFYKVQIEYYAEKYNNIISNIKKEKTQYLEELKTIENKHKIKKWERRRIMEINESLEDLKNHENLTEEFVELWSELNVKASVIKMENAFNKNNCYDVSGQNKMYSPSEYKVLEVSMKNKISWIEYTDLIIVDEITEINELSPKSTKWVKKKADRNCLSSDPDDCLVWCLVEVPGEQEIVVVQEGRLTCPLGFELGKEEKRCEQKIQISSDEEKYFTKIIDRSTNKEIIVQGFKEVKCK